MSAAPCTLVPAEGVIAPSAGPTLGEAATHLDEACRPFGAVPRGPTVAHAPVTDGPILYPARWRAAVTGRAPTRRLLALATRGRMEVLPLRRVDLRRAHDLQAEVAPILFATVQAVLPRSACGTGGAQALAV